MAIFPFTGYGLVSLLRYLYSAESTSAANVKNFKTAVVIIKKYYFRIIIKNLTKCNILSTFAQKNYGKFTGYNLEKLCPQSLASTTPVLSLERVCPQKVGPWPRIF